jgi:predicted AlkP superfamily pyrophosphatase or phosphodiesterase
VEVPQQKNEQARVQKMASKSRKPLLEALVFSLLVMPCAAGAAGPERPPTLVVTIVVDQYSADVFSEYRSLYHHGLATLASGAVFPHGYQSHAATETCPGHSTVLTGAHPANTGIIANEWQGNYCVMAPNKEGKPVISPHTLLVPTLGDRLRDADTNSRTVAIGGKDRAAVMLGGKKSYLTLWWDKANGFVTYKDAAVDAAMQSKIDEVNKDAKAAYATAQLPRLPAECESRSRPVEIIKDKYSVGELHETEARSDKFRATPAMDALTLEMAKAAVDTLELGKGKSIDVLAVSFSATDYVGHYYGTEGAEMCTQQLALDKTIEELLTHLERKGISFVVALTADHGGPDIPERNSSRGVPQATRLDPKLLPESVGATVAAKLKLEKPVLLGKDFGNDIYLAPSVPAGKRGKVLDALRTEYDSHRDEVAAVFTRSQLIAAKMPTALPDQWSLLDRARASFNEKRSGDLVVLLQPYVTTYERSSDKYISSHGSAWDYDRRVPIIFWWPGIAGFEQPAAVETVDIAPTLADLIGLKVGEPKMDGRVLQIGKASN